MAFLLLAGCVGPTDSPSFPSGQARILITSDLGTNISLDRTLPVDDDTTVLDLLQEATDVQTAHDGGFVHSINGKTSGHPDEKTDWFYHVNGRLASTGAGDHPVTDGDIIVWDHRPWNHTMTLPWILTGLPEWPGPTETHNPEELGQKTASPHIFLRVQGEGLQILDPWGRTATTIAPPWLAAHVIDEDGAPRLLLASSDEDARGLTRGLEDHAPTGLGIVLTPDGHHPIPAPEP